jgi:hypothetical protein
MKRSCFVIDFFNKETMLQHSNDKFKNDLRLSKKKNNIITFSKCDFFKKKLIYYIKKYINTIFFTV